mgnify:CR=1 FL=1
MTPLGLGIAISGSVYGGAGGAGVVIEDNMWQLGDNGTVAGELEPIPTTYDFHDIWDLDGTDYMLDADTATADEEYWILAANSDVEPLDV